MDLLAFLFVLPFGRSQPRTDMAAWQQLSAGFAERGVAVVSSHPRCAEPNLDGLYVRGRREVVVCERGDRSITLRHEGWHLVQSLCLRDRPWLEPAELERRLSRDDRRELQALVTPERWAREAEARVMAQLKPTDYLATVDQLCQGVLKPIAMPLPAT